MALNVIADRRFVILASAVALCAGLTIVLLVVGSPADNRFDRFGVREIYHSKKGGPRVVPQCEEPWRRSRCKPSSNSVTEHGKRNMADKHGNSRRE